MESIRNNGKHDHRRRNKARLHLSAPRKKNKWTKGRKKVVIDGRICYMNPADIIKNENSESSTPSVLQEPCNTFDLPHGACERNNVKGKREGSVEQSDTPLDQSEPGCSYWHDISTGMATASRDSPHTDSSNENVCQYDNINVPDHYSDFSDISVLPSSPGNDYATVYQPGCSEERQPTNRHPAPAIIEGRRIFDVNHLFSEISRISRHSKTFDCNFENLVLIKEERKGMASIYHFQCSMCGIKDTISSEPLKASESSLNINDSWVSSMLHTGQGYSQLRDIASNLEMPCMAKETFQKCQRHLSEVIKEIAWEKMLAAGKEESQIAIEAGEVDDDGVPVIDVVTDGAWCKRSYGTSFNALSGMASIIGARTRKVLFASTRNTYCCICARASSRGEEAKSHTCYKNWTKSSTAMEADIIVEGFRNSVEMHSLKYKRIIGQVDLWTQEARGCSCPYEPSLRDCACCVWAGGCHCGPSAPNRCAQCGLEQHCANMCNVTIDSRSVSALSGKTFGQIKSPSLQGPAFCWYVLRPDPAQRVELQVYRLVSVGRFNGTSCQSGFLQLVDGSSPSPSPAATQVCGSNERYDPPVVLFADKGPATLLFHIGEPTIRSQFLAYFSFTPKNGSQGTAFQPRGGHPLEKTECDWLYQDFSCREPGSCVLASPGYPGLYPHNRRCRYRITTSSIHTQVSVSFSGMLLPHNHCGTDYIAIYQGSSTSSPLLTTLCANKKATLTFSGPSLLLEFSSGPSVPPYNYNGFMATLEFRQTYPTTEPSSASSESSTDNAVMMDGTSARRLAGRHPDCGAAYSGGERRSGHFDTRVLPWGAVCDLVFRGRPTDVVHVSLFNYKLGALSCQSTIEIYDGLPEEGMKPVKRICSPVTKHARDKIGRFLEKQTFVSSYASMTLMLKRLAPPDGHSDVEFVDGAYLFHDEQVDGTLQPATLCDVDYYGLSSSKKGRISNPGGQHLFWNIEGPLRCIQRFIPATNQSITISVTHLSRAATDAHCHTQCGDSGCRCVSSQPPLSQLDHLLIVTDHGHVICCLCGEFQQEWLPVSVRSWSPVRVVYSVAHYTWTTKGFNFAADYTFHADHVCGHQRLARQSGVMQSASLPVLGTKLNHFYYLDCTWLLDSKTERQLTIDMETSQNRPCTAWNMSVHLYDADKAGGAGEQLRRFCPRDKSNSFSLPWKTDAVLLRLRALTRTLPEFAVQWRSQAARANTRVSGPTAAGPSASRSRGAALPGAHGALAAAGAALWLLA